VGDRSSLRSSPALEFAVASLATWRVAHLISAEDGPLETIVRLRRTAGDTWAGDLMDCFYCLSLWVAAPLTPLIARRNRDLPAIWLGLSGASCLLERITEPVEPTQLTPPNGSPPPSNSPEPEGTVES
jgi:Protein of unknown function (DUF1360)